MKGDKIKSIKINKAKRKVEIICQDSVKTIVQFENIEGVITEVKVSKGFSQKAAIGEEFMMLRKFEQRETRVVGESSLLAVTTSVRVVNSNDQYVFGFFVTQHVFDHESKPDLVSKLGKVEVKERSRKDALH